MTFDDASDDGMVFSHRSRSASTQDLDSDLKIQDQQTSPSSNQASAAEDFSFPWKSESFDLKSIMDNNAIFYKVTFVFLFACIFAFLLILLQKDQELQRLKDQFTIQEKDFERLNLISYQKFKEMELEKDDEIKNLKINLQVSEENHAKDRKVTLIEQFYANLQSFYNLENDETKEKLNECTHNIWICQDDQEQIDELVQHFETIVSYILLHVNQLIGVLRNFKISHDMALVFGETTLSLKGKLPILLILFLLIFKLCKNYFQQRQN